MQGLPQGHQIDEASKARWASWIQRFDPDRAAWHFERLKGIGGSEMGAVVRGVQGLSHSGFSTITKVVEQKLLQRMPLRQDSNMLRGTVLEHLARLATQYRYNAAIDSDAIRASAAGVPKPGYEWLKGNEDDALIIKGRRLLADYKVPSTFSENIDFDYEVQLHHYGLKGRMAGVKYDGYLLVKLDLAPELAASLTTKFPTMTTAEQHQLARTIAAADVPGMRVVALGVPHDHNLDVQILESGRYAWEEYVLKGVVPQIKPAELIKLSDADTIRLADYQKQYAMAKAGMNHLQTVVTAAEAGIQQLLAGVDLDSGDLPINIVNISKKNFDKTAMVEEAISLGASADDLVSEKAGYDVGALVEEIRVLNGDPTAAHLFDKTPDPSKAKTYLEQLDGFSLETLRQPGVSVAISRKKKDKEISEGMTAEAASVMKPWFEKHAFSNDFDAEQEHPDVMEDWTLEAIAGALQGQEPATAAGTEEPTNRIPMKSASLR